MKEVIRFLQTQRLMTIGVIVDDKPWTANLYYGCDVQEDVPILYAVSPIETLHSKAIQQQELIAFNIAWYDEQNFGNRKAIQGKGICKLVERKKEIEKGIAIHNKNFPLFADRLTLEHVTDASNTTSVWSIIPTYIKFWNDELYGSNGSKKFFITHDV